MAVQGPLDGKVAVVTGATSGIGRAVALRLASLGATTVVVGRGVERAAQAARTIAAQTSNRSVESLGGSDLALRSEMDRVARELGERYRRLSILVNNAGAYFHRREATPDGLERTFALNVLAPFVLTSRLRNALEAGAPSRVVQLGSAAHRGAFLDFENLQGERSYRGFRAYARSKLGVLLLTREFARRWPAGAIGVNAVHPGFVRSRFGRNNPGAAGVGFRVATSLFGISVARGAATPVYVATSPEAAGVSGEYFVRSHPSPGSRASRDPAAAARLFAICSELAAG